LPACCLTAMVIGALRSRMGRDSSSWTSRSAVSMPTPTMRASRRTIALGPGLVLFVCRNCGHHFRMGAERRLKLLFDDGAFARIRAGSLLTRRWSKADSNRRSHPKRCGYERAPATTREPSCPPAFSPSANAWDRGFESPLLQRRDCKPSGPLCVRTQCSRLKAQPTPAGRPSLLSTWMCSARCRLSPWKTRSRR
jgi:hypothetical protein